MILGNYEITIKKLDPTLPRWFWTRRNLARKVDKLAGKYKTKIERIKATRKITGAGLTDCKEWVEIAFDNYGAGRIR